MPKTWQFSFDIESSNYNKENVSKFKTYTRTHAHTHTHTHTHTLTYIHISCFRLVKRLVSVINNYNGINMTYNVVHELRLPWCCINTLILTLFMKKKCFKNLINCIFHKVNVVYVLSIKCYQCFESRTSLFISLKSFMCFIAQDNNNSIPRQGT